MPVNPISSSGSTTAGTSTAGLERAANPGKTADFASVLNSSKEISETDLDSIFEAASKKYNVPINLLKAVGKVESSFHPNATSRCGAMGIMQLMPRTAKSLGVSNAYDPEQNIMGGAKYLSKLLGEFNGDTSEALAAYNAGPGAVKKYGGVPPFAQGYVDKVMGYCNSNISAGHASVNANTHSNPENVLPSSVADSNTDSLTNMLLLRTLYQMLLMENSNNEQDEQQDEQNVIF